MQVLILAVIAFNGSSWIDTACIATSIRNFPEDRGTVVGKLVTDVDVLSAKNAKAMLERR